MMEQQNSASRLDLPADLVAFLTAGKQLAYDPVLCEAGAVTLLLPGRNFIRHSSIVSTLILAKANDKIVVATIPTGHEPR
jgi:hypothetical protein